LKDSFPDEERRGLLERIIRIIMGNDQPYPGGETGFF